MTDESPATTEGAKPPESLFTGKQWGAVVVVAFFLASISVNFSVLLSARFTRSEIRTGVETEFVKIVDADGKRAGTLSGAKGGGMVLESEDGKSYLVLSVKNGCPSLVLVDRKGKHRAAFGLKSGGEPRLKFADPDGKISWSAP
jgi:hypothetical protein